MSKTYDAVIIGGGHNGLVCGAYLARAGRSVCVLERRHLIGGAAVTEELWPGFKVSTASYTMALLQPRVILELDLKKYAPSSERGAEHYISRPSRLKVIQLMHVPISTL